MATTPQTTEREQLFMLAESIAFFQSTLFVKMRTALVKLGIDDALSTRVALAVVLEIIKTQWSQKPEEKPKLTEDAVLTALARLGQGSA